MNHIKLFVETRTANLWWGIYGFGDKTGWEDLLVFDDQRNKLGEFCLCTKRYLRHGVEGLRGDGEQEYVQKIDAYLGGNDIVYSFSYNDDVTEEENYDEVPHDAPRNSKNEKPFYIEIWHPDEGIGLSTLYAAVEHFAAEFLKITPAEIILDEPDYDETLQSFKEHGKFFDQDELPVAFADELVEELAARWKISPEETLEKLKRAVK